MGGDEGLELGWEALGAASEFALDEAEFAGFDLRCEGGIEAGFDEGALAEVEELDFTGTSRPVAEGEGFAGDGAGLGADALDGLGPLLLAREVQAPPLRLELPWLGTYRWRVAARDARGVESRPSDAGLICSVAR